MIIRRLMTGEHRKTLSKVGAGLWLPCQKLWWAHAHWLQVYRDLSVIGEVDFDTCNSGVPL